MAAGSPQAVTGSLRQIDPPTMAGPPGAYDAIPLVDGAVDRQRTVSGPVRDQIAGRGYGAASTPQ